MESTSASYISNLHATAAAAITSRIFIYPGSWGVLTRLISSSAQAVFGDAFWPVANPRPTHHDPVSHAPPPTPYAPNASGFSPTNSMLFMDPGHPTNAFTDPSGLLSDTNFDDMPLSDERGRQLPEPPSQLSIEIDDSIFSLDSKVERFISSNAQRTDNSLSFSWGDDQHGLLGRMTLRALFDRLKDTRNGFYCPIDAFKRMSFAAPPVAYKGPFHLLGNEEPSHDCVDFADAPNLTELFWQGDLFLLTRRCLNVPFENLRILSVINCTISVNETIALLHSCPKIFSCDVQTVENNMSLGQQLSRGNLKPSDGVIMEFSWLEFLSMRSNEPIGPIFEKMTLRNRPIVVLTVGGRGAVGLADSVNDLVKVAQLTLAVPKHIDRYEREDLKELLPDLIEY